jgi:Protein of unknown function (DUF3040)
MGGVVPLSEHEQRQLEQIEQALHREDRRLVRLVRSSDPRVHYKRRAVQATGGFAVGAGMVAAGVVLPLVWLAVGGFAVMLVCGILSLNGWRHVAGSAIGVPGRGPAAKPRGGRKTRGKTGRGAMMERLDERWRRRQEGGM